ncbi:unnamed protein product [Clonostachys solani]|uniref:Uncharacterized protein n=1 Tax=Clonostachys solani TaxID=160281 RepID=A0A9N9YY79_9HYPO|nr:unnamed protein product [Clonostachys solani]
MLRLPNEILAAVVSWLETERDINALVLTSRHLYHSFNSVLYRRNAEDFGGSALTWAVLFCREETAIKAVNAGAPGGEALWHSVRNGDEKTARLILSSENADGNFQDRNLGETPLLAAVNLRDESMLKLLLGSGKVKVDLGDRAGRTPLLTAADMGYAAAVELLLDSGQSEMQRGDYGVLEMAIMRSHAAVVKLLMEHAGIAPHSPVLRGETPLYQAMRWARGPMIETMMSLGEVDINARDQMGTTPFLLAAAGGYTATVKLFLDSGKAEAGSHTDNEYSALMLAISGAHDDAARMLLEQDGVDVNHRGDDGHRALSLAAREGLLDVVKTLIGMENVDVDSRDNHGFTPLAWAATEGHLSTVELLLDSGRVDPDSRTSHGYTPWMLASGRGHEAVMRCLVDTGKIDVCARSNDGTTAFLSALGRGKVSVLKLIVESGDSRFDQRLGERGRTALVCAVYGQSVPVTRYLLDSGKVDVNEADELGRTALHHACAVDARKVTECLLQQEDLDANVRDYRGFTPLVLAAGSSQGFHLVKLLLQSGKVDAALQGHDGATAISVATSARRYRTVRLLAEWDWRSQMEGDGVDGQCSSGYLDGFDSDDEGDELSDTEIDIDA